MRMSETRIACSPSWLASIMRMIRNMPKRRLFMPNILRRAGIWLKVNRTGFDA